MLPEIDLARTHNEETSCNMSGSCCWEQFRCCVSASSVHLASVFIRETSRVHRKAHGPIFPVSPVAAGNASTVHSSSAAAQELVSFPRDIALNKENAQQSKISTSRNLTSHGLERLELVWVNTSLGECCSNCSLVEFRGCVLNENSRLSGNVLFTPLGFQCWLTFAETHFQ